VNRRTAAILLGTVFILALSTLLLRRGVDHGATDGIERPRLELAPGELVPVELYFPSRSGRLATENRDVPQGAGSAERLQAVVESLIAGPTGESTGDGTFSPLPEAVEVGSIHVSDEGVAYVDLLSTEHASPPATGTRDELLSVYSIVNSLLINTPEVEAIVLLWNGQQLESFAGHIDTTRPLIVNSDL